MIDVSKLIFDNSIWLAIIAINMTIIGFTSLAESKIIIGIDYGKFLINKYKVFGWVRIYYLLIVFASVNIISLFMMFSYSQKIRAINLIVLLVSLVFAIYYFFGYILIENKEIKAQIFRDELLGMYYDSKDKSTFEADLLSGMSTGWRTEIRSGRVFLLGNALTHSTT